MPPPFPGSGSRVTPGFPHAPPVGSGPPRITRRRSNTVAWAICGVVVALAIGGYGWSLFAYANHDHIEFIELPKINAAIKAPCERLAVVGDDAARAPDTERAAALAAVADAMDDVAASVEALDDRVLHDDYRARPWAADWRSLAQVLREYATALAAGTDPTFATPVTEDGYTIVYRMDVATGWCEVPDVVAGLDKSAPLVLDGA